MRKKLVAGNWKMHGSLQENTRLLAALLPILPTLACDSALCVPFPYLAQLAGELSGSRVALGAQTLSEHASGAYTGEVSGGMLADFGCRFVLVGHSERRSLFAESDTAVAEKFAAALVAGLTPVLCVGETLLQREAGETEAVVSRQLQAVLARVPASEWTNAVVAYEPVWAIGTGLTASPEQAQAVHVAIRGELAKVDVALAARLRILYGGSVKAGNARDLFQQPDIDGGLIGGASLVAEDFLAICRAAV